MRVLVLVELQGADWRIDVRMCWRWRVVWRTFGDNSINNRIISKDLRNTQQLTKHCCWLIAHVFFHQIPVVWFRPLKMFFFGTWTWSDMKRAIVAGSPDLQWFVEFLSFEKKTSYMNKGSFDTLKIIVRRGVDRIISYCLLFKFAQRWTLHPAYVILRDFARLLQDYPNPWPISSTHCHQVVGCAGMEVFFCGWFVGKIKCKTTWCNLPFRLDQFKGFLQKV